MKRIRSFIPATVTYLGIACTFCVGIVIGAQDQDDPKPDAAKIPAKAAQKAPADQPANQAAERAQPQNPQRNAANQNNAARNDPANPAAAEEHRQAVLGAEFNAQGEQGISVTKIDQNGVLAQGGLRQNDRIVSVYGRSFASPRQFEAFIWAQGGQQVPVIIERGGQRYTLQIHVPHHLANSGWMGVNLDEGDADVRGEAEVKGARVTQVYPSGPAARAGVMAGDVITQINQQPVEGSADAVMLIRELRPQATAELLVLRDKEQVKIPVVVGTRGNFQYQSFYSPQQQQFNPQGQQGGDQHFGNDQQGNQFGGVPPHAMQLEHDRRIAEQHERIEDELRLLKEEVKKLRELLEKK